LLFLLLVEKLFYSPLLRWARRKSYFFSSLLVACGLKESVAVGTWEGQAVSAAEVAKQFATVFDLLSNPTQIGVTQLEQLWIYID